MEYVYTIVMACLAGGLLLYAGMMALFKNYKLLPLRSRQSVKPKDPRKYMTQLAKVVALVAVAPAVSAVIGIWSIIAAVVVLVAGIVLVCVFAGRIMKKAED
ncbi:MAG: hypothetical protein J5755_05935 [Clostridia bacterium]|nr:hypothetical protein [Clostridia bacterium]